MSLYTSTIAEGEISDVALAERAGAGDERAFETLDRRHRPTLLRQCTHILRNSHDAEEAVQSALLKAYRALARGQRPASVLPWLSAIARNESFDVIRARRTTEQLPPDIESRAIRPDEVVVRREEARVLRADLEALPEAQRAALVLRSMGDLPHAEIAERLGGTAAEARTLCHEARLSLAEFQEGRVLECSEVLARIASGDGRALRARRIRAHLRACEGCRSTAAGVRAPRRSRLAALFPFPSLALLRAFLFGGAPSGVLAGAGSAALTGGATLVVAGVLAVGVSVYPGDSVRPPAPSPSVAAPVIRATPASATPAASTPARTVPRAARRSPASAAPPAATPAAGASVTLPPVGSSAPGVTIRTPAVHVPAAGITVPSVQVPVTGITVPSLQVPLPPVAGIDVTDPSSVVAAVEAALAGVAPGGGPATPALPVVPTLTP